MTPDHGDAEPIAEQIATLSVAATVAAVSGHPVDDGSGDPTARRVAAVIEAIAAARPSPGER